MFHEYLLLLLATDLIGNSSELDYVAGLMIAKSPRSLILSCLSTMMLTMFRIIDRKFYDGIEL